MTTYLQKRIINDAMNTRFRTSLCMILMLLISCRDEPRHWIVDSEAGKLTVEVIADSIRVPFGMSFLPDGNLLVTDRGKGEIVLLNMKTGAKTKISGPKNILTGGDGGILDILVHPDYSTNGWIYYTMATGDTLASTMVVERAKLEGDSLAKRERLFTALPLFKEPNHYGSRLVIQDGYLFISMGERFDLRDSAQLLNNHLGKIMRLFEAGGVPPDNPFVNVKNARPEIWSYGHRNPQGLTLHPTTGELWEHEHGPKGGDEINIIKPGVNYGWPVISYGVNYDGTLINNGLSEKAGMEQPLYYYKPSIAPSGMAFYTSDNVKSWKGNLFIGALALRHLNRLVLEQDSVVHEERLLKELNMRVRNVKLGPDGNLYLGVDGGMILRVTKE